MKWTPRVAAVYFLIALYAVCFKLQAPIEPFLVEKLGKGEDSVLVYGKVQSAFGTAQMVGTFAMGPILDKTGARLGLVVVFLAAFCSYALLATADSIDAVYWSKVPAAFQHPFLVAQTFMAQQTTNEDRAEALGLLVTAFTGGATIGPILGGWLGASGDYFLGARLAAGGMLLNVAIALLMPGDSKVVTDDSVVKTKEKRAGFFSGLFKVLTNPALVMVFATKLSSSTFNSMYESTLPMILKDSFKLKEAAMGSVMSASMLCNAIVSGALVGPLVRKFTAHILCGACLFFLGVCYLGQSAAVPGSSMLEVLAASLPIHAAVPFVILGLLISATAFSRSAVFTSVSTSVVPANLRGTALSLEHTMFSMSGALAPTLSAKLLVATSAAGACITVGILEMANACSWTFFAVPLIRQRVLAKADPAETEKGK